MWPSLSVANRVADVANLFFIGSLVVGVVATVTIVWMTGIKEKYWDADRIGSAERIAGLTTQADQLRKDTADANARASEASEKAEAERLERVKLEAKIAPRRLSSTERDKFVKSLSDVPKPPTIAVVSRLLDPEGNDFADDLSAALAAAGWHSQRYRNWTLSVKGTFVAVAEGTTVDRSDPSINGLERALAAAELAWAPMIVATSNKATMDPYFQPNVLYLLVGAKP